MMHTRTNIFHVAGLCTLHTNFLLFVDTGYDTDGTDARACGQGSFWKGVVLPAQIRCYINLRTFPFFQKHLPLVHAKEDAENRVLQK